MVVALTSGIILLLAIATAVVFVFYTMSKQEIRLLHKLYISLAAALIVWFTLLLPIGFDMDLPVNVQWMIDAATYVGASLIPPLLFLVAVVYTKSYEKLPKILYLVFLYPLVTTIIAWTNPWHHMMYKVFSINNSEIVFGPYIIINSLGSILFIAASVYTMMRFAFAQSNVNLYRLQAILFSVGSLFPLIINALSILKIISATMLTTPLTFLVTLICHGIAIFKLNLLDITPIARNNIINWMSDGFVVISEDGLILDLNNGFKRGIGAKCGIYENGYIYDAIDSQEIEGRQIVYNILQAMEDCKKTDQHIIYQESPAIDMYGEIVRKHYMVEVLSIKMNEKIAGYMAYFKDVTKVKESMERLKNSHKQMMENERLASLGQMVGGIAHNLKTPIMAISGSALAVNKLIDESNESLGDPDVTVDDFREIYEEMSGWIIKIREACTYMSDIITAVKDQAVSLNTSEKKAFPISDVVKRVELLMRHELTKNNTSLQVENNLGTEVWMSGDMNNLVQVINNLVTNAVYAQVQTGRKDPIVIAFETNAEEYLIHVKDRGAGVPPHIKERLFREMITSKGAQGTGLGLYVSSSVINGKFSGRMAVDDNPGGGAVFTIAIPVEKVVIGGGLTDNEKI